MEDPQEEGVPVVKREVFEAMLTVDVDSLERHQKDLRPVLASLVRMSLISAADAEAHDNDEKKTRVLRVLSEIELVNNIVALLSVDFPALEAEIKKEQALKAKGVIPSPDSTMDFERSDATGRLRLVLKEVLLSDGSCSELFNHVVYLSEICDVLCIALAELPHLLSAPEVAESLLKLKYGPCIITHIVANQPDSFADVAHYLLKNGEKQEEDPNRTLALLYLSRMNPSQTLTIRSQCAEYCRLPGLAVMLTLEGGSDDLIPFISGILLGSDPNARSWISIFIRSKKKNTALSALRNRLLQNLKDLIASGLKSTRNLVQASSLLRLYTALRGIGGLKFTDEEIEHVMDLITIKVPIIPAGFKFVTLGLCMIIACNFLIGNSALESRAIAWLRWLVDDFESEAGNVEEMLLLMAIHFHSQQFSAVSELACTTLGMKIAIRNNNMTRIKHIFTQEVFTENVVAAHAIKVPVTDKLSSNHSGFLPVHCIHQLLKSRAFSKNKVPIKEWIYRQICASKTPLHPVLPSLIEVYVNSILIPASNRGSSSAPTPASAGNHLVDQTNEPISEVEVSAVFKSLKVSPGDDAFTSTSLAPQMLMLYYVLLYDGVRLSYMKSIIASNRRVLRYSQKLLSELPLKFLLRTAENKQHMFGGLFPQLLRLCSTHYPHLCSVNDWLETDDSLLLSTSVSASDSKALEESDIVEAFSEIKVSPVKATLVLQRLLELPIRALWPFAKICMEQIHLLLEPGVPRQILNLFRRLWFKLNSIFPRKLWVYTINSMRRDIDQITLDGLIFDPLHVLRVSKRVFCIAPLLEILIYILRAALAASRTYLTQHMQNNPLIEKSPQSQVSNDQEREELKMALIITQESAAIQILLEAALLRSTKEEDGVTGLKEIQCIVCSYLHEAFISDPHLAKLVHFQGYPLDLLPVTVSGVPSMHICLDFAPELLSQPCLEKQVFAVDLISHLSIQYALPKSYSTARLAINAVSTLLSVITVQERSLLIPPLLPAFVRFSKAFPPLLEDTLSLLLQISRISLNEASMTSIPKGGSRPSTFQEDNKLVAIGDIIHSSRRERELENKENEALSRTFSDIIQASLLHKRIF